jgi:hypothetical protein
MRLSGLHGRSEASSFVSGAYSLGACRFIAGVPRPEEGGRLEAVRDLGLRRPEELRVSSVITGSGGTELMFV